MHLELGDELEDRTEPPLPFDADEDQRRDRRDDESVQDARAYVGENDDEQDDTDVRDAKPRFREELDLLAAERDQRMVELGAQRAQVAVGPHDPPVEDVGMRDEAHLA